MAIRKTKAIKKETNKPAGAREVEAAMKSALNEDRELQATMNVAAVTIETLNKALNEQIDQNGYNKTVISLAVERARQRANRAIVEFDEAMTEISRLTADPSFSLHASRDFIIRKA